MGLKLKRDIPRKKHVSSGLRIGWFHLITLTLGSLWVHGLLFIERGGGTVGTSGGPPRSTEKNTQQRVDRNQMEDNDRIAA